MKRLIEKKLLDWKNSKRRKPLILRGARQIGKTWIIKNFGDRYYKNIVIIDFEKERELHSFFEKSLDPVIIKQSIEIIKKTKIIPEETLLFFDEIQSCPRAITALRYFYEEMNEIHVIAAGSLLEFALSEISFPVGRVQFLNMYPMTFAEYLMASENETALEIINSEPKKLPEQIHDSILRELRTYFFIGGMPESIKVFIESGSISDSFYVHKELITTFQDDFSKYAPYADKHCLGDVFKNVAKNIGNQIKYTHLSESFSSPTIKKAFEILLNTKIIKKIPSLSNITPPFNLNVSLKKFKTLLLDIGLWQHLSGMSDYLELTKSDLSNIYRGALAEQFVGQELICANDGEICYWARDKKGSSAEIDYLVTIDGKPYPIEVKSGKAGSLKSMHMILKNYPDCPSGIVFSTRPFEKLKEQKLIFLPLYYSGGIKGVAPF
ncbi:MAG: AAA family ATPase [Desulfobacula sp.]|uniref:ATP-binding protein n=1 Tax=Desulfobacula sp. TaxID=2593537 RepID=UPI0025C1312B|nr:AAA family ATPase [Desulfobacula sp.]MCD4721034.1 AAA family ATPase [Desulfobacula sp.]